MENGKCFFGAWFKWKGRGGGGKEIAFAEIVFRAAWREPRPACGWGEGKKRRLKPCGYGKQDGISELKFQISNRKRRGI
jgi:hypothetical protein